LEYFNIIFQITLFSTLSYYILKFLSGTRGAGVLKGIALIFVILFVALYEIARNFDLNELEYLLAYLWPVSMFVLAIVFQPELRRAFVRLGEHQAFFESRGSQTFSAIDEILEAVQYLARNRIGALIVLSGDIGLGSYQERGVLVNSAVKWELLVTIFWDKSPLHDGAVIISNDKIMAARCWIPEISDATLSGQLGTRHRAGLRLTEDSDALSIIVSEETGHISVAVKGELAPNIEEESLNTIVKAHYITHRNEEEASA
jgi:diadenylate cyclase